MRSDKGRELRREPIEIIKLLNTRTQAGLGAQEEQDITMDSAAMRTTGAAQPSVMSVKSGRKERDAAASKHETKSLGTASARSKSTRSEKMKSDLGQFFTKEVLMRMIAVKADELVPKPPTPDPNKPQKNLEKDAKPGVNPIDQEILVVDRLYSNIPTIDGAEE